MTAGRPVLPRGPDRKAGTTAPAAAPETAPAADTPAAPRRAQRGKQTLHRRPVHQARDAFQPAVRTHTRWQQRLRQARLSNPPLTHPRLAITPFSTSANQRSAPPARHFAEVSQRSPSGQAFGGPGRKAAVTMAPAWAGSGRAAGLALSARAAVLFSLRFREVRVVQEGGGDPGDRRAVMAAMSRSVLKVVEAELLHLSADAPTNTSFAFRYRRRRAGTMRRPDGKEDGGCAHRHAGARRSDKLQGLGGAAPRER